MTRKVEDLLEQYAEKRADEVFDISIDELRQLVIDGAKWLDEQLKIELKNH